MKKYLFILLIGIASLIVIAIIFNTKKESNNIEKNNIQVIEHREERTKEIEEEETVLPEIEEKPTLETVPNEEPIK